MPIPLGILAAAGFRPAAAGAFDLLETTVLSGVQNSVTFTNLVSKYAAMYQHLQLRVVTRTTATINSQAAIRFNSDSSNSYSEHLMNGGGSSISTYGAGNTNRAPLGTGFYSNDPTGAFGFHIVDLLDPFETTKNKTVRCMTGGKGIGMYSSGYFKTEAISTLQFYMEGGDMAANSRLSLYGLKATA